MILKAITTHKPSVIILKATLAICLILILGRETFAYETDQFSTPPAPLTDVSPKLSQFVYERIRAAVTDLNAELESLPGDLKAAEDKLSEYLSANKSAALPVGPRGDPSRATTLRNLKSRVTGLKERLASLKTKEGLTLAIHERFGSEMTWQDQRDGVFGLPLSIFPPPEPGQAPESYLPGKFSNIYSFAGFHRIISPTYFVFSSTVRVFGVYLGVDKLGHFFNQGQTYYTNYHATLARGLARNLPRGLLEDAAWKETIAAGAQEEDSFFGTAVDGVYSNADLAANAAGFYFYENLFEQIQLAEKTFSPLLRLRAEGGIAAESLSLAKVEELLHQLFTNHLNEALNPSRYEYLERIVIKKAVRARCSSALAFYGIDSREAARQIHDSMSTWFGREYGFSDEDLPRLDELCF